MSVAAVSGSVRGKRGYLADVGDCNENGGFESRSAVTRVARSRSFDAEINQAEVAAVAVEGEAERHPRFLQATQSGNVWRLTPAGPEREEKLAMTQRYVMESRRPRTRGIISDGGVRRCQSAQNAGIRMAANHSYAKYCK